MNLSDKLHPFLYHYYRAEVHRETVWRNRLDVTTNWSIVTTGAILTFAFGNPSVPHGVILLNYLLVWFFLYIESRRFRYYMVLKHRTRWIEKGLLAPMLEGKMSEIKLGAWSEKLRESLVTYGRPISKIEAIAWRVRRNYMLIFPVLLVAWLAKLSAISGGVNFGRMFQAGGMWIFPGEALLVIFLGSVLAAEIAAIYLPEKSREIDLP